jgi:hypothetical protein
MLDLKFIVHHGDFAIQSIYGRPELAGSDVNLAHRLLKNHVSERTGWSAYMLFSKPSLERTGLTLAGTVDGTEEYEHLGVVETCVVDLHERYEALMRSRHVVVEPQDALVSFSEVVRATPAVLWSWLNDPERRAEYASEGHGMRFIPVLRPEGRTGAGATTHCVHGKNIAMRELILDWKPFDYYTVQQDSGPFGVVETTFRLEPVDAEHTRLTARLNGRIRPLPEFLSRPLVRLVYGRIFNYRAVVRKMKAMIEAEAVSAAGRPSLNQGALA